MAAKEKNGNDDAIDNPALFAGLKFYDGLMSRQKSMTLFAFSGDLAMWRNALQDYYSFTSAFISKTNKTSIEQSLSVLDKQIQNYLFFSSKLGAQQQNARSKIQTSLFALQKTLMESTSHLNLKTSKGESGRFDARSLFTT